jgi:type III restriction enzyme
MRITLRAFQEEAVDRMAVFLAGARRGLTEEATNQAVGLAAPTGSGKTIIATAVIERLIFGGEDGTLPDPTAIFLWITDMPELNEQTRDKMLRSSSNLGPDRLIVVESTFDAAALDPGRVWFLNIQKLGEAASLAQPASDERAYSFWETVTNTIAASDRTLYVVIDEAHRGMVEGANREAANSIIQRFIKGWNGMPPSPIVLGISATPERYQAVIEGTDRTSRRHVVPPEQVRESGLIKDRIMTAHAGEKQTDEMALLEVAAAAWKESTDAWVTYCAASGDEELVVPALVVQVENEEDGQVTRTDLEAAVRAITRTVGPLEENAYVHAFQDRGSLQVAPGRCATSRPAASRMTRTLESCSSRPR